MVQYPMISYIKRDVTLGLNVEEGLLIKHRERIILERSCRLQQRNAAKLNPSNKKKGLGQYKP